MPGFVTLAFAEVTPSVPAALGAEATSSVESPPAVPTELSVAAPQANAVPDTAAPKPASVVTYIEQIKGQLKASINGDLVFDKNSEASHPFDLGPTDSNLRFSCVFRRSQIDAQQTISYKKSDVALSFDFDHMRVHGNRIENNARTREVSGVSYHIPIMASSKLSELECNEAVVNESPRHAELSQHLGSLDNLGKVLRFDATQLTIDASVKPALVTFETSTSPASPAPAAVSESPIREDTLGEEVPEAPSSRLVDK